MALALFVYDNLEEEEEEEEPTTTTNNYNSNGSTVHEMVSGRLDSDDSVAELSPLPNPKDPQKANGGPGDKQYLSFENRVFDETAADDLTEEPIVTRTVTKEDST